LCGRVMSVQFVGKIGERFDSATGTTSTVTTSVAVPVGRFLVLAMRAGGGNVISTVTDSASNTWQKLDNSGATNTTCSIWYCTATSALAVSSTITATVTGSTGNRNVAVWAFDGITRPTTTDTTARTGSGTTLSPANVTPEQYASLMFTAVATNATNAFTVSAGWTALTVNTASVYLGAAYAIQNSMDALATTWTWTTLGNAGAVTGSFTPDGGDFFNVF
jgi:hypothetical protein